MEFKAIHPKHGYTLKQFGDAVGALLTKEHQELASKQAKQITYEGKSSNYLWLNFAAMAIAANPSLAKTQSASVEIIQYFSQKYLDSGMMFFAPSEFDSQKG